MNNLFQDIYGDPFFGGFESRFQPMRDPFASFGAFPRHPQLQHNECMEGSRQLASQDLFYNPFDQMNRMMNSMRNDTFGRFSNMSSDPNSSSYSYSSVMSYSNSGDGEPKYFEATSSSRTGRGLKETRKTVRDSESGLQKMALGHHMDDKGHVVERQMNRRTGERNEKQDFINLEESEADAFHNRWQERVRDYRQDYGRAIDQRHRHARPSHHRRAVMDH